MESTFQKYEVKLEDLKTKCRDELSPFWAKTLQRSISACDMHVGTLDGFRVKVSTLERHLTHVLTDLKPYWSQIQERFDSIQSRFNAAPKDVPRTGTVCQVIRNGLRHFLLSSSCYSKESMLEALDKLQMDLDRLETAIENHRMRKRIRITSTEE